MNDMLVDIVAYAGLAVFVLGDLMIASAAYRRGGLIMGLIGLIPVLNFYHVAVAWTDNKTRNGFLMLVAGALAVAAAFYGGADETVSEKARQVGEQAGVEVPEIRMPVRAPSEVEAPNQAEVEAAGIDTEESVLDRSDYIEGFEVQPLPPEDTQAAAVKEIERAWYPVCPADLPGREGKPLRLTTLEGRVLEGKLAGVEEVSLVLEQYVSGGIVNFEYKFDNLERIEVYEKKRGPVPAAVDCTPPPPPPAPEAPAATTGTPATESPAEPVSAPVVLPPPTEEAQAAEGG